jgi:hypothetical protein
MRDNIMNNSDYGARRTMVYNFLEKGTDLKRLSGGTEEAYKLLNDAYELAHQGPALPEPWLSITSYRLAHLIMRIANSRDEFERANKLFVEASPLKCLGPLPSIYRVAVVYRLKKYLSKDIFDEQISEAYNTAIENISDSTWQFQKAPAPTRQPKGSSADPRMQTGFFNMVELVSYMSGLPYQSLEGLNSIHYKDILLGLPTWYLVGRPSHITDVVYQKELAFEELDSLGEKNRKAVYFKLSADLKISEWKSGSMSNWETTSAYNLRLLALLLKGQVKDLRILRYQTLAGDDDNSYRQVKKNLKKGLAELLNIHPSKIYERPNYGRPPRLQKDINGYGAIEESPILQLR